VGRFRRGAVGSGVARADSGGCDQILWCAAGSGEDRVGLGLLERSCGLCHWWLGSGPAALGSGGGEDPGCRWLQGVVAMHRTDKMESRAELAGSSGSGGRET
jgi:hypothetical protein